jgi:hypothetical protein
LQTLPSLVWQAKLLVSSNQLYSTREGNIIFRRAGIFGVAVAALLALPGVASAHDPSGAITCPDGVILKLDKFPRNSNVNWRLTQDGQVAAQGSTGWFNFSFNKKVADLPQDGQHHEWKLYALPWSLSGHTGGSETVPVASNSGTCGTPSTPPPNPNPPATPVPPPTANECVSRRVINVRVARKWKNKLRSGQLYYRGLTQAQINKGKGKLRLRTKGAQKGKLVGAIDFRGLKWNKDRRTLVRFKVVTNGGRVIEGGRLYRPCTITRRGINLPIGSPRAPLMVHNQ